MTIETLPPASAFQRLPTITMIGEIMTECIFRLPRVPRPDETLILPPQDFPLGGAVLNVCWYLSALGTPTALVSFAGSSDVLRLQSQYEQLPVDLAGLVAIDGASDRLVTFLTATNHHSAYILADLHPEHVHTLSQYLEEAKHLVLNGGRHHHLRSLYTNLATQPTAKHVFFNPSYAVYEYDHVELEQLLRLSDICFLNSAEKRYVEQILGERRLQSCLTDRGLTLVVTKGREGVTVRRGSERIHVHSILDRHGVFLGAGDAFVAGYVANFLLRGGVRTCLRLGLSLAALVVESSNIRAYVDLATLARRYAAAGS